MNSKSCVLTALVVFTIFISVAVLHRSSPNHLINERTRNHSISLEETVVATNNPSDSKDPFIVHFVRIYDGDPTNASVGADLYFLECMSLLSVTLNIEHDWVYIHANDPKYWPLNACRYFPIDFHKIKILGPPESKLYTAIKVRWVHHVADIMKLEAVAQYGGLVIDFDVLIINGSRIRETLKNHYCIVAKEQEEKLNAGFLACQPNAAFPKKILASYVEDFRDTEWVYNSGVKPYLLYKENPTGIYSDTTISVYPDFTEDEQFWFEIRPWQEKMALHTFVHDRAFGPIETKLSRSVFGEILRWIAERGAERTKKMGGRQFYWEKKTVIQPASRNLPAL